MDHETPRRDTRVVTFDYYYNFCLSSIFALNTFYAIILKKEQINYSKFSAFASSARLHLLFTSNCVVFVDGGHKNISCLRAQGTLATLLNQTWTKMLRKN